MRVPLVLLMLLLAPRALAEIQPPERWAERIASFVSWDRKNSVPGNAVLFVGSSSIVRWKTRTAFPDLPVINRGFGGSYLSDTTHYFDQIVAPYKPRAIVLYAGDNDIAAGMTPERVADDFKTFVDRCRKELPQTRIVFVAIKPSLARWKVWPQMEQANRLIEKICQQQPLLRYADIATPMLGVDGKPRADLLDTDTLHLSPSGYQIWNRVVAEALR